MPRPPRQMHGRRALAAAAAAALLLSLFAPWYRDSIVTHGLTGLRTMTITRSGWEAFSFAEAVVLVVAVVALAVVIALPVSAAPEGRVRLRPSGVIVAVLGAITLIVVLAWLAAAPGTSSAALAVTTRSLRWGAFLALGASALLTVAGLRLVRAPRAARAAPPRDDRAARPTRSTQRSPRPSTRTTRAPRTERAPRSDRTPASDRAARSDRAPRTDRARPSGARPEGRGASPTPAARRAERPRPARRPDRPRWEEQSTDWLDLPD